MGTDTQRRDTHREDHVKTEAEIGVRQPQAKEGDSHENLEAARN